MSKASSESQIPEVNINDIISDLGILSEKCKRDIDNKFYWSIIYSARELNRLLTQIKNVCPNRFDDVSQIQISPDSQKEITVGSVSAHTISYLHEIEAEASKVFARLVKERGKKEITIEIYAIIQRICDRFHQVARQLRNRHENRPTIDVKDEYDVQDLIHGLLKIYFDDIRTEEWTPSYAGSASRMDFLLKTEQIVIEVKKTRDNLADKEIGKQLIEDIAKYKEHPDCRILICFVYDPEGKISNPTGLENDLARLSSNDLEVRVFIQPS